MKLVRASLLMAASAATLLWMGCKDKSTEPVHTLNGHWVAVFSATSGTVTLDLTLTQTNTSVTGAGTIANATVTTPVTITGSHVHPSVTLTVAIQGYNPATVTGTCASTTSVSGSINGSGFTGQALTLNKQAT